MHDADNHECLHVELQCLCQHVLTLLAFHSILGFRRFPSLLRRSWWGVFVHKLITTEMLVFSWHDSFDVSLAICLLMRQITTDCFIFCFYIPVNKKWKSLCEVLAMDL